MIIRERTNEFVMIEQDHHAFTSGEIMKNWKEELFLGEALRESVEYAIYHHDYGWKFFDQQPLWNDKKDEPYSFIDFPIMPKTVLYKHGIDAVEKEDKYAALICSNHYTRFMERVDSKEAKQFVHHENKRQQKIIESLESFDEQLFRFHYSLLRFGDDISLYLCLNEPGITNDKVHPFFHNGLAVSSNLIGIDQQRISIHWEDKKTISISEFPFKNPFTIQLKQKRVPKQDIAMKGLIESYANTAFEEVRIHLTDRSI